MVIKTKGNVNWRNVILEVAKELKGEISFKNPNYMLTVEKILETLGHDYYNEKPENTLRRTIQDHSSYSENGITEVKYDLF